ncbi:MAG TPA: NADH-quinone oxidoreductase subunit J [Alphaproteobacteria bacterium]|nr:NADH-quinone oxidoreductase subunit J [Alphaproteobacteria bacterium]HBC53683.1 NADH-quinone oxidoreductase subunit J [Alphaproteobacteria bacterium]
MIVQALAFYLFAAVTVAAAFMVIVARNPVHSVLFLILTFFNAAGLFVLIGAEFLAMILVVVYVGAVAVLFLFVVMMLDIDFVELRQGFLQYVPIGAVIGLILMAELILVIGANSAVDGAAAGNVLSSSFPVVSDVSNADALGRLIYTEFAYLFEAAGMVLLVAMIGAIVLTLRQRPGVRKQNISAQVSRRREDGVELRDVKPGQGI